MSESKRNVTWMTVTDTGEKPDVEIHMAGFKEDDGIATHCNLEGGLVDLMVLCCNLVEHLGKTMQKEHGIGGAVFFIDRIGTAIVNSTSKEAAQLAAALNDPTAIKKAAAKLAEMLFTDEEEDDE